MPESEIELVDGDELNLGQSFIKFKVKEKIY